MILKIIMKKLLIFTAIVLSILQAQALEDCIVFGDGKLTDIKIQDNTVINVYPHITLMNEKNTLIVQPLKEGTTKFSVLKNGKKIVMFNVTVSEDETKIDEVEGFEILQIDKPFYEFELDTPPIIGGK